MVTFFTTTLIISISGIALLLLLKQIELSTGTVILGRVRPQLNRFFHTILLVIERSIPGLAKDGITRTLRAARAAAQVALAHAILRFEAALQRMLHLIREKTHPQHHRGEASAFLKEVGEYKKQIESEASKDEIAKL